MIGHGDELDVAGQRGKVRALYSPMTMADGGDGAASGKPVAPADDESGVVAERAAREIVLAAAARNGRAEFGQGRRAE